MEAIEEPPLLNASGEGLKVSVVLEESDENAVASVEMDVCHKSNGVSESPESGETATLPPNKTTVEESKSDIQSTVDGVKNDIQEKIPEPVESAALADETVADQNIDNSSDACNVNIDEPCIDKQEDHKVEEVTEKTIFSEDLPIAESTVEIDNVIESSVDRVTFQTEILVETNDNDVIDTVVEDNDINVQDPNNILSELGQSIELSEALRSSDVTDNVENNNCAGRQEVLNKEELLDILEGNNEDQQGAIPINIRSEKLLETQLALQQLSQLKSKRNKYVERRARKDKFYNKKSKASPAPPETKKEVVKKEENIVNVLVKEWDDEDGTEVEKSVKLLEESENVLKSCNEIVQSHETAAKDDVSVRTSVDSATEGKTPGSNKSGDEGQPQRRLGRVIKKKVIFDPDNPDTFTKSKPIIKSKSETGHDKEKDQTPSKKIKTEQNFQRSKSKSPLSKLQWKKPSPKSCKQNKRLTEVDKLLMDEGAVNMIYQLTPEAPKGRKNMRTKAEFIKKIQSSTPDSKEMKFRERKKESKFEEGEARRIIGGKRSSLSSSVKSPSVGEDFEAISADDSIIYRRHSSSSYSSSCMSPRRLSDVEVGNPMRNSQPVSDSHNDASNEGISNRPTSDVFLPDVTESLSTGTINKSDCLSIKEKLNSKLNIALNKRKRDNAKVEKPLKQKKVMKYDDTYISNKDFQYIFIKFDQRLAEICVQKSGPKCNVQIINELEKALTLIESRKDISVTLLSPDCGTIYSELDLRPLLDENLEKRANYAHEIADSVRRLLLTVEQHKKLLCAGVNGRCSGLSLALVGLSDMTLASERASFALTAKSHGFVGPLEPGVSVFTAHRLLTQPLLNDLVVFGRRLSASEALQGGLVTRLLWPDKFAEQVHTIVKDIAAQPTQNILLKKQLLNLKNTGSESTFPSSLEKERDLLVKYWTSEEGQDILRGTYNTA